MSFEKINMPPWVKTESAVPLGIDYTKQIEARLKNTYYPELEKSGLKPYLNESSSEVDLKQYPMQFCYVCIDYGEKVWREYLAYFLASIGKTYPDCPTATINYNVDKSHFIAARCQAYTKMRRELRGNLVFLDFDIIAYQRTDPFVEEFDVGLTDSFNTWPLMPFNGGMRFVKDTPAAQKYMDAVMEIACGTPEGMQDWWLDQLAMKSAYDLLKNEVNFKIFPHLKYNFVPNGPQATDAYFIHFKGDRKHLMKQYLAGLLGTDHIALKSK